MDRQNSFFEIPLLITAFVIFFVAFTLRNYRKINAITIISYLLVAVGIWSFFYGFEISVVDLNFQMRFAKLEYLGLCAIPPLWFYFSVLFAYPKRIHKPKEIFGLFLPFLLTLGIVFTNDMHHWFWRDSTQVSFSGIYLLSNTYGFWFWIHTVLSYVMIITGSILVIITLIRKKHLNYSVFLVGMGALIPIIGSLIFVTKLHTPLDLSPFAASLSGVLVAVSMVQFNFFNLKPIAKSTLFSSLPDPVFFINNEHIIIEANDAAQQLFEISEIAFLTDRIETVFQNKTGIKPDFLPNQSIELVFKSETRETTYQVFTKEVLQKNRTEGYLVTLKDVSIEKQINQANIEEVTFTSLLNEIVELSINSSGIDILLDQVVKKISNFLGSDHVFIVRNSEKHAHHIDRADKESLEILHINIEYLSSMMDEALIQKKTIICCNSELIEKLTLKSSIVSGLLVFPLFANNDPFGVLVILLRDEMFPGRRQIAFLEYSLTQIMFSVARLQVLERLERTVVDRTSQVVKLNTELQKNFYFLDRLVDTSQNQVFSLDAQDIISFCNNQFIYEFGFTEKKAVIGKHISVVFKSRHQGLLNRLLEINHDGERSGQYDCTMQLNLGIQKHYSANKTTFFSQDNMPQENIFILNDLTKQKKQESKLRNSEQRLLSLFESMPVVLFEEDHSKVKFAIDKLKKEHGEGVIDYLHTHPELSAEIARMIEITDCNKMALDFYGFSSKQELFNNFPILLSETASQSFQRQLEEYILGKTEFESEDIRIRLSGEQVYVKMRLHIPPENTKDFRRVLVSVVDITQRKKTENDLANSEEKFRNIIKQSVDGIILFDQKGKIIEWNIADEKITGYSLPDIQDLHIWDFILLLTKDSEESEFLEIKDQLKTALFDRSSPLINKIIEITITTKDDRRIMIAAILTGIEIGKEFVGSIIIRDVSGIKKSQAEVQKLASAVREISEGLIIADKHGLTEYVNIAVETISGYSHNDLIGKNLLRFFNTDFSQEKLKEIDKELESGNIQRGKVISRKKDGTPYTLQYNIAPIGDEQGNRNYVSVISDVSQSELMDQQNRQAQKLEAIGSLAAGVAHEINTPTQYVGNNLLFIKKEFGAIIELLNKNQQLLRQAAEGRLLVEEIEELHQEEMDVDLNYLSTEIPRAVTESLEGIGRVTKIVQAIKEFSHPSMDERTPVDINRAIDTTITVSRNEWKYVADLIPQYEENLPTIVCSPGEINQVILNLITNAAHAIKEQIDKGVYSKGLIEISTFSKPGFVEIHVRDNGGGIPVEYREKVFNPFFTTKPVGMGTGQGLSISYKVIVNKHNGSLRFESEIGKGTTFIITLPLVLEDKSSK